MYLYFPPLRRAAGVPAGRRRYLSLIDTTVSLYPRTGGVTCISPIQTTVISLRLSASIILLLLLTPNLLSHEFFPCPVAAEGSHCFGLLHVHVLKEQSSRV